MSRPSRPSTDVRSSKRLRLGVRIAVGLALATGSLGLAVPAHAAAGDPFDPSVATVFIAQISGTQTNLLTATTSGGGSGSYSPAGPPVNFKYNSIAYNTADDYIYGIVNEGGAGIPAGALVRVAQGNVVTRVGTDTFGTANNTGVFGPDGYFYVADANTANTLKVIDTTTGTQVSTLNLSAVPGVSDLTYADGYFWGVGNSTRTLVRIDPATGQVKRFGNVLPANTIAGSMWTYGNGNLGIKNNNPGVVYQLKITNASSDTPTFALVSTQNFPATSGSDGTAIPGVPPTAEIIAPTNGAAYEVGEDVTVTFECGSSAVSCEGTLPVGASLDTSTPGTYTFEVTATDSAGTVTTVYSTYTVVAVVGTPMISSTVALGAGALLLVGLGAVLLRRRVTA